MTVVRILSDNDVSGILDIRTVVKCMENAYVMKAENQGRLFPLISEDLFHGRADMDIKSGMLNAENVFGLKLVAWFGDNQKLGLPAVTGLVMSFDLKNGFPKAIISARHLTEMRTGAAGAVGIKHLARPNSETLLVVGTGAQAVYHVASTLSVMPTIKKVYIFNPRHYESAVRFKRSIKTELSKILNDAREPDNKSWLERIASTDFIAADNPVKALQEADAVITITPSREALILKEWVRPGTHFSCIGADMLGKQEIDEKIFAGAVAFVDDVALASTVGESQKAVKAGIIGCEQLTEIGHLIQGSTKGRLTDKDITIFDSIGIALQDLAVASYLTAKAAEMNIGAIVEL